MKQKRSSWFILLALNLAFVIIFFIYTSIYYHADGTALAALTSDGAVTVERTGYGWRFDGTSETDALIFYPGAKVEETAYAPLCRALAEEGMDVCLVKMPFRLAVLNSGAAAKVMSVHDYNNWYIGGHSLGGAMAASYAAQHGDAFCGVILFAAYATKQLPEDMTEIVLVGSEDQVINRTKLAEGRAFAPARYLEREIVGGNHAQFGHYGAQKGDGVATISAEQQIQETVRVIKEWK